jgi:minor extracellular serine protease Vpr
MVAATLLLGLVAPATLAAEPQSRFERIPVSGLKALVTPALLNSGRVVNVMVELAGQPVAVQDAQANATGRHLSKDQKAAIRANLKAAQGQVVNAVRKAGGVVVGQLADAYNGVHARVPLAALAQLETLPGVVAVHAVQIFQPDNGAAVPYVGAPQAWTASGLTGKGVIIADIDTGIDYYHANFGGSGNPGDFTYGFAHSTTVPAHDANGTTVAFPSAKVPIGFDFVGDDYDAAAPAGSPKLIPHPDPNPLDCPANLGGGHGSHTAGSAAGFGVLADGSTFSGPYNASIYASNTFNVAPGAAPGATIYAYRVFGCSGSSDVVAEAIDQAVKDGANVINMSLSSPFGRADDPTAVASQNAVNSGVVVVASAGNEGPNAYMVGSPSTANGVISVAAMDASRPTFDGAAIGLASGTITGIDANDAPLPVSGPIKVLKNPDGTISLGCATSDYASVTAGDIVVTQRGVCARVDRATFGQAAGAAAVIMVNTGAGLPPFEGPIPSVTIPFIGVLQADGPKLVAANGATVTISATTVPNPDYQSTASFSSGGPRNGDSAPKPDVVAPGVSVLSTGVGTGTGGVFMSGTSMAAPMVTGSAALVRQAHPTWTPNAVKAALVGTADASPSLIKSYNARLDGAGVIQDQRAATTVAYATTPDQLDSLVFGYQPLGGAFGETKSFTLHNTGASPITYNLSPSNGSLGSVLSFSPSTVTVAAGASADVAVTISLSAAAVSALPSADTFAVGAGAVTTARGAVVATPGTSGTGIYSLRIPFLLAPRPLSSVTAGPHTPYTNHANVFSATSPLTNSSTVFAGTADVYAWGLSGPNTVSRLDDTEVVRAVGVQSLAGGATASDKTLVFAINTWGRWSTPSSNEFDVAIDTNADGKTDFFVVGFDLGQFLSGAWDGRYGSFTLDAAGNLIDAFLADAPMNGSTVELPTFASDLGLSSAKPTFSYAVAGFSIENPSADFVPGTATFNAFAPTISTGQFLTIPAGTSATLGLTLDRHRFDTAPALGWMVVSLDDANGAPQADLVPVGKLNPQH